MIDPLDTRDCQHRYRSRGHDPGVRLRHLYQVRHATCTSPVCQRPAAQCEFEHNTTDGATPASSPNAAIPRCERL
jgi:hypothetical protein